MGEVVPPGGKHKWIKIYCACTAHTESGYKMRRVRLKPLSVAAAQRFLPAIWWRSRPFGGNRGGGDWGEWVRYYVIAGKSGAPNVIENRLMYCGNKIIVSCKGGIGIKLGKQFIHHTLCDISCNLLRFGEVIAAKPLFFLNLVAHSAQKLICFQRVWGRQKLAMKFIAWRTRHCKLMDPGRVGVVVLRNVCVCVLVIGVWVHFAPQVH